MSVVEEKLLKEPKLNSQLLKFNYSINPNQIVKFNCDEATMFSHISLIGAIIQINIRNTSVTFVYSGMRDYENLVLFQSKFSQLQSYFLLL